MLQVHSDKPCRVQGMFVNEGVFGSRVCLEDRGFMGCSAAVYVFGFALTISLLARVIKRQGAWNDPAEHFLIPVYC